MINTTLFATLSGIYLGLSALAGKTPEFPAVLIKAAATASLLFATICTFFHARSRGRIDKPLAIVLVGLPWCIAGDVFLGIPGDTFFLPGLASFLLGYAIFAVSLVSRLSLVRYGLMLIPALIPGVIFLAWFTLPADLVWPVRVFVAVQTAFLAAGLSMLRSKNGLPAGFGAILLYASDAVIGIGRFTQDLPSGALFEILVLAPYFAGLFLFVTGSIRLARQSVDR